MNPAIIAMNASNMNRSFGGRGFRGDIPWYVDWFILYPFAAALVAIGIGVITYGVKVIVRGDIMAESLIARAIVGFVSLAFGVAICGCGVGLAVTA